MRYQDQMARMMQRALDDVCRSALAVDPKFHDWRPSGEARSVLGQMREIASSGVFFVPILREGKAPKMDDRSLNEARRRMQEHKTLEDCIIAAKESTAEIATIVASIPDQQLELEIDLPFGGGMRLTIADVCGLHYWNMVYHLGQINQIQLMLGDSASH